MAESVTQLQVKSLQSKKKSGRLTFLVKITRRVGPSPRITLFHVFFSLFTATDEIPCGDSTEIPNERNSFPITSSDRL
jgi:hypothetical protein